MRRYNILDIDHVALILAAEIGGSPSPLLRKRFGAIWSSFQSSLPSAAWRRSPSRAFGHFASRLPVRSARRWAEVTVAAVAEVTAGGGGGGSGGRGRQ